MRPGPARGERLERRLTVEDTLTARVGEREIHPVLGTVPLAAEMERICRELLEPHLEEHEEGIGYALSLEHHSPAPVGAALTVVAEVAAVDTRRLVCEVSVRDAAGRLVASGSFDQRIVAAAAFAAHLDERRRELDEARPAGEGPPR